MIIYQHGNISTQRISTWKYFKVGIYHNDSIQTYPHQHGKISTWIFQSDCTSAWQYSNIGIFQQGNIQTCQYLNIVIFQHVNIILV